ncbi:MAG: hypothetical protein V4603_08390 [Pseudomonadota bacterium]
MGMLLIHVPGAAIYLTPGYSYYDPDIVTSGFYLTTYGMLTYVLGVLFMTKISERKALVAAEAKVATSEVVSPRYIGKLARNALFTGLFISLVVMPALGGVATLTSLLSGVTGLTVVGICLGAYGALLQRSPRKLRLWLLAAASLPLITLASSAFIGYGMNSLVVIMSFLLLRTRTGPFRMVVLAVAGYLCLSFFVTYMRDRSDIRNAIWEQNAQYSERFGMIADLFTNFEFFDRHNPNHLKTIDDRLNQNWLVGMAIPYVGTRVDFANGETIIFSFVALVPRAIWPSKPQIGGGGNVVTTYTGIRFDATTSVGAGQVLEFYVNFGRPGVYIGFFLLGMLIKTFDSRAARGLMRHDFRAFLVWLLAGLGFLQAGGNFVEVTTSVVASIASGLMIILLVRRRRPPNPVATLSQA